MYQPINHPNILKGKYLINREGKVWSKITKKLLNPCIHRDYPKLSLLNKNKERRVYPIHRLVALTFLPQVEGKNIVNHIDGDKTNFHLSNLEWCSAKENSTHASVNGLTAWGEKNKSCTITKEIVLDICKTYATTPIKLSHLAEHFDVSISLVTRIIEGQTWKRLPNPWRVEGKIKKLKIVGKRGQYLL